VNGKNETPYDNLISSTWQQEPLPPLKSAEPGLEGSDGPQADGRREGSEEDDAVVTIEES